MFIADHVVQKKDACVWNVSDCNPIYAQVGHSKLCDAIIVCITQYLQKRMANCHPDPSKSWLAAQDPTTWRRLFLNIDWFNVKIIIQKFGMTRGWSTYESCCEPLNYSDSGLYHLTWYTMNHGFRSKWDQNICCFRQPQKIDWLVYYLIQRTRSSIFNADVYKNDEASSTARYTTSMNFDIMCRKIRENLVIGYHPTGDILPHLNISIGSAPLIVGFRCLHLLHARSIGLEISRIVNWISIFFTSDGTFQRSLLFGLLQ